MHRRSLVAVSVGAHAALLLALFAAGIWHLERLDPGRRRFDLAVAAPPPAPPAGSAPAAHALHIVPKAHRRVVHEPVQPALHEPLEVTIDTADTGAGTGSGSGTGAGSGAGSGSAGGTCTLPFCGVAPQVTPPPPLPPVPRPATVAPPVLAALRISGDTQIEPPDRVEIALERDGKTRTLGIFELCIDAAGAVHDVRLVRSTGYSEYDQRLAAAIWRWRYRPYRVGSEPVAACGAVTFEYRNE